VCLLISTVGGIYCAVGELHHLGEVGLVPNGGWPVGEASTNFLLRLSLLLLVWTCVLKAMGQTDIKHGRPAKEFCWPAGPWALPAWGLYHSVHVSNTSL
jgi:hypothetical protein